MIYLFLLFYSIVTFFLTDIIPISLIINGYIFIILTYFIFPYVVKIYITKFATDSIYNKSVNSKVYITKAPIVKGGMSIYLPLIQKSLYAVSEKAYQSLDENELEFLILHEKAHIVYKDQTNNILSFFTVVYVFPILLTYLSTLGFVTNLIIYLIFASAFYIGAFILYFVLTSRKEIRADKFATKNVDVSAAISALIKLHKAYEIRERTFNVLATHPSCNSRIQHLKKKS